MNSSFSRVALFLAGLAAIAGVMALIVWGTSLAKFTLWKFFVLLVPVISYVLWFIASKDSLKFLFFTLFATLPVLGILMPPVSLGVMPLDVIYVLTTVTVLSLRQIRRINLMPVPIIAIGLLFVLPSIVVAIDSMTALVEGARLVGAYMIFVLIRHYLKSEEMRKKVDVVLLVALTIVAISVLLEKFIGINLSNADSNLNSITVVGQSTIKRAGGLFQDPQKAGQFLAVLIAYSVVLWSRGVFSGKQYYGVIGSVLLGVTALLSTVSRLAIGSGFLVSFLGFLFLSHGSMLKRIGLALFAMVVGLGVALSMSDSVLMKKIVPEDLLLRFATTSKSTDDRFSIWEDSWHVFADNPIFGIGPGTYQEYLMRRDSRLRRLHEQGGYVPSQPESGYLTILYEMGVLGAVGFILVFITAFGRIVRNLAVIENFHFRSYTWAIAAGSTIYFTCFFTLFTPSDPRNAILPVILLAILPSPEEKWDKPSSTA